MTMKYSAINIGPILSTLGMARKPRELWTASYLFSHLMKCIYQVAEEKKLTVISPAKPEKDNPEVGIYPDRIYIEGEVDVKTLLGDAMAIFYKDLEGYKKRPDLNYFNLMSVSCEADSEPDAIGKLNQKLDVLELCNYAVDGDAGQTVYEIISDKQTLLYKRATKKESFPLSELQNISNTNKNYVNKSNYSYFCVVQADGDNVGKTVSNLKLKSGDVKKISEALVNFGLQATQIIKDFGGLPIYAGGDDLLFIAPVIGKDGSHVFKLLDEIENKAFKEVHAMVSEFNIEDDTKGKVEASLSYGLSITYYKYPLYEALEKARKLLRDVAKHNSQKKAVAWSLRKHSGGTFEAVFSRKNTELWKKFMDLIDETNDDDMVSAVAHKIRQNDELVRIVLGRKDDGRLDALFENILEYDKGKSSYFEAVKLLMPTLFEESKKDNKLEELSDSCGKKEDPFIMSLYAILRIAKFINGEEQHDE